MDKKKIIKEEVVAEYLTGNISYRALGKKYSIPSRSICDWVMKYQGRFPSRKEKEKRRKAKETGNKEPELSNEVKVLQKALQKSQLKSELSEKMLKLSEEHTGIEPRKKFGTKRQQKQNKGNAAVSLPYVHSLVIADRLIIRRRKNQKRNRHSMIS